MIRIYAIVVFLCSLTTQISFASGERDFSVKQLVRTKLWHEGVDVTTSQQNKAENSLSSNYPEELSIALDIIEAKKTRR